MTPAARISAAIQILDQILAGEMAEPALIRWARRSRFAGSGDRHAVRDLVFDSLRRLHSRAALGGALTGRGVLLGTLLEDGTDPASIFTGQGHAPAQLSDAELSASRSPSMDEALDLPQWLLPEWRQSLGQVADETALLMRDRAPIWLRSNPLRGNREQAQAALADEGIETLASELHDCALMVTGGERRLSASAAYRDGLVELQDLSPQLACGLLPKVKSVLDYCAGGGGKALAIAATGAQVVAHDADPRRMADLPARAARAGAEIGLCGPGQIRGQFDMVVIDVPCSGSGTWRRTPDAKWRLAPQDLDRLAQTQREILEKSQTFLTDDGFLAYMTCSVMHRENGGQVSSFMTKNNFKLLNDYLFLPQHASDGFYLAVMQRC